MSAADADEIHRTLAREIAAAGGTLAGVYICPHEDGECDCRKPLPGLLHRVVADHPEVTFERSVLVGDTLSDLQAAAAAGVAAILVGEDRDAVAQRARDAGLPMHAILCGLADAVDLILSYDKAPVA